MTITIGDKKYKLNPAAITLIRYRIQFGKSFLNLYLSNDPFDELTQALADIVYVAIEGEKPPYEEYLELISADGTFLLSALAFQKLLLRHSDFNAPKSGGSGGSADIDELQILAAVTVSGAPEYAVMEFPIFDLLKLVGNINDIKLGGAGKKYRKMTNDEMIALYGG